jgi:predicted PurR-regulated permease PerM
VIVIATLFVIGLTVFSALGQAVIAPLAYLGITALEGQVITPTLIGHRLTINPFLVFLSIAFWAWMWGPVGPFLAVPILLCAMVVVRRMSSTGGENAGLHATAADGAGSSDAASFHEPTRSEKREVEHWLSSEMAKISSH